MKRGFSLIEFLVVLSILMILVSLLFPVFSKAKDQAQQTVCISNVRQLYAALELYEIDTGGYSWHGFNSSVMKPYVGSTPLRCPAAAAERKWKPLGDYENYAALVPEAFEGPGMDFALAYRDCREKRGGDFPVVVDENRTTPKFASMTGQRIAIIARQNGAVKRVVLPEGFPVRSPVPCQAILWVLNL